MAGSVVRMMCPNLKCRRVLGVPSTARGKNVRCGTCGTQVHVPAAKAAPPHPAPSADR